MAQRSLFDDNPEPEPAPNGAPAAELSVLPYTAAVPVVVQDRATKEALLAEVREPALVCTRCSLAQTRANVVFGEGNPAAPLVFVGEGPGENEDATGRPFVGRAGKLLDQVLRENGMTREHVYICNTLKCRAANFEDGRWKNRPPSPEESAACAPWLKQQLEIIRPLVVVCLGGPAANAVIHTNFRITAERGRWFQTSPFAPWTMAAFHPAYILRMQGPSYGAARQQLVDDIAAARRKVIEVKRQLKEQAATAPPPPSLFG